MHIMVPGTTYFGYPDTGCMAVLGLVPGNPGARYKPGCGRRCFERTCLGCFYFRSLLYPLSSFPFHSCCSLQQQCVLGMQTQTASRANRAALTTRHRNSKRTMHSVRRCLRYCCCWCLLYVVPNTTSLNRIINLSYHIIVPRQSVRCPQAPKGVWNLEGATLPSATR